MSGARPTTRPPSCAAAQAVGRRAFPRRRSSVEEHDGRRRLVLVLDIVAYEEEWSGGWQRAAACASYRPSRSFNNRGARSVSQWAGVWRCVRRRAFVSSRRHAVRSFPAQTALSSTANFGSPQLTARLRR
uniref:Uncharacterized protein n=1 Tax=Plectus sambesii TaxID=2011161 RepID=A0A914WFU8_9BILA